MVMAPVGKVVLGSFAYAIFWVLAVFPSVPLLPLGRTAGSLLGAMLMVLFRVMTPEQAYGSIDLSVLGLLFGTMILSVYLEKAEMFKYLGVLLSWKSQGAKDLLCRICIVSALASALFTNDTCCIVLTKFVLDLAKQHNIPPHPLLLALASSANIGSSATPIGNPQNLIIAIQSKIPFGEFLLGIFPAMLVGILINIFILLCMYWRLLHIKEDQDIALTEVIQSSRSPCQNLPKSITGVIDDYVLECSNLHVSVVSETNVVPTGQTEVKSPTNGTEDEITKKWLSKKRKKLIWKTCVYFVTTVMIVFLLMGYNMSWTILAAALALIIFDFRDAGPSLEKVSYSLLVFFCGMFITISGFNRTGIPNAMWDFTEPHAQINQVSGIIVLSLVIIVLSNLASNVPTVLLLGTRIAASASAISPSQERKAWLVLAWVSTVAGNLSLLGSAANLIVCEQARLSPTSSYTLTFWTHVKFGFFSTLIITGIGLLLIRG